MPVAKQQRAATKEQRTAARVERLASRPKSGGNANERSTTGGSKPQSTPVPKPVTTGGSRAKTPSQPIPVPTAAPSPSLSPVQGKSDAAPGRAVEEIAP